MRKKDPPGHEERCRRANRQQLQQQHIHLQGRENPKTGPVGRIPRLQVDVRTRRGPPQRAKGGEMFRGRLPRIKSRRQEWVKAGRERGGGVGRERGRCKSWRFGERTSVGGVGQSTMEARWRGESRAEALTETGGRSGGRRAAGTRAEETRR